MSHIEDDFLKPCTSCGVMFDAFEIRTHGNCLLCRTLLDTARKAAKNAYCPYSRFHVGAAVLTIDGAIVSGCNIENASYGLTVCAERTAIFIAVSRGWHIERLAVSCIDSQPEEPNTYKMPCGACRQVMAEFMEDDHIVIVDGVRSFKVKDLLPSPFTI